MPLSILSECPKPPGDRLGDDRLLAMIRDYADDVQRIGVDAIFGLELRAALHYDRLGHTFTTHLTPSPRKFFYRPAIEPILYSYKDELSIESLQFHQVDNLVSCMQGWPVLMRDGPSRSFPNDHGNFAVFPDPEHARGYLDRIRAQLPLMDSAMNRCLYVFAEVILSHPYSDGNGRLARAFMFSSLARDLDIEFFDAPFGPVMTAYADSYISAIQTLTTTGNWVYFAETFQDLIRNSILLGRQLLKIQHS